MAITIDTQPGGTLGIALCKNPMLYTAKTSEFLSATGRKFSIFKDVSGEAAGGDTITLGGSFIAAQYGGDLVFTCVLSPSAEDEFLKFGAPYYTINQWLDYAVLPVLNAHPQASEFFVFTRSASRLIATAKDFGSEYTLTISSSGDITMSTFQTNVGTNLQKNDCYIRMRIHMIKQLAGGEYDISPWMQYDPLPVNNSTNGTVSVDLSDAITGMMSELDNLDALGSTLAQLRKSQRRMFVEIQEVKDGVPSDTKRSDLILVLKAGQRSTDVSLGITRWTGNGSAAPIRFLTHRPSVIWTHTTARDFLSFFNRWNNGEGDTVVSATVYYNNGTTLNDTLFTIDSNAENMKHEVYSFRCGFKDLGLDEWDPGEIAYKYTITVTFGDPSGNFSQNFKLLPETDLGCSLIYYNAFGMPEGLWCEGARETGVKHERSMMDVGIGTSPLMRTLREKSYGRSLQPMVSLISAPMYRPEWIGNLDLLQSENYLLYIPESGEYCAAQLEPGDVTESTLNWQGESMTALQLQLRLNKELGWSTQRNNL